MQGSPHTLALDIGATKIAFALIDSDCEVLSRGAISSQGNDDLWAVLSHSLKEFAPADTSHIGIATAGPIDLRAGSISPVNIAQWRNFEIVKNISQLFPNATVRMIGDCTALALAEHSIGAGKGFSNLLGVVVSTGIGGGLVINGKVLEGESGNAGLIGHHTIAFDSDRLCVCGRTGCLEEFARGPKMVETAHRLGWVGGEDFQSLAASAEVGDQLAKTAIELGARALAVGLVNAMMITDVHTVVIGGGVSFAGEVYLAPLRAHLKKEAELSGFLNDIKILPATLGADAGLIGAAIFAQQ